MVRLAIGKTMQKSSLASQSPLTIRVAPDVIQICEFAQLQVLAVVAEEVIGNITNELVLIIRSKAKSTDILDCQCSL